jgi:hypothetical protein
MMISSLKTTSPSFEGKVSAADFRQLASNGPIDKLSLFRMPTLTTRVAQELTSLQSVNHLFLWCDVTRTAMRHVIAVPGLKILNVLGLSRPGRLENFAVATRLETFRCYYLTEEDLLQTAKCNSLQELCAVGALLSPKAVDAIIALPNLERLDLEDSELTDTMAGQLSTSKLITSLDVGSTKITREGLRHICKMKQLRSLDIWALPIQESDLDLLAELPNLEYLSVGELQDGRAFRAETLIPRLNAIASLKQIWLDGVKVSATQKASLEARYESVRITNPEIPHPEWPV